MPLPQLPIGIIPISSGEGSTEVDFNLKSPELN